MNDKSSQLLSEKNMKKQELHFFGTAAPVRLGLAVPDLASPDLRCSQQRRTSYITINRLIRQS
jgi:hypothetical protein